MADDDLTAKVYALEQRLNGLIAAYAPAALQPGTGLLETWHDLPSGVNGWGITGGGWKKYRLTVDGSLEVSIQLTLIGTKTDGTLVFSSGALPTGYRVSIARRIPVSTSANALSANNTPWMGFLVDGSINISGVNVAGLNQVDCHTTIPLI